MAIKICLVSSRGGHLFQMTQLQSWWMKHERFWVTFPGKDVTSLLKKERKYYGYQPVSRNVINAVLNFFLALKILLKEKPDLIVSCGAGIAPPFFLMAKLLRIKAVYVEPFDFVKYPTLSGKLIDWLGFPIIVQQHRQIKFFKSPIFLGKSIL